MRTRLAYWGRVSYICIRNQLIDIANGEMAELVYCTGLENRRAGNGTGGSNPSFSAHFMYKTYSNRPKR